MPDDKQRLIGEAKRIEEYSLWNAAPHFTAAAWAVRVHLVGGSIPIVLGGIGGWNIFTEPAHATSSQGIVAGLLTVSAGIVGSLMAFWNLSKVQQQHFAAAVKYKTLENEARRAHEVHAHDEDYAAFKIRVMDLARRYDEIGEDGVLSSDIMFWLAGRKIRRGLYAPDANGVPKED